MDNLLLALYAVVTFTMMVLPSLELLGGGSAGTRALYLVDGALALVLAATILWRRLRWEPVGGGLSTSAWRRERCALCPPPTTGAGRSGAGSTRPAT